MSPKDTLPQPTPLEETKELVVDMLAFRAEIAALIIERKKQYIDMIELLSVNPDELTMEDAQMWYRVKNYQKGSVTRPEYEKYSRDVVNSNNPSRINFRAVIANKLTQPWIMEELEEDEKIKSKRKIT